MDLFEYQGKQYFARYGIPVSAGGRGRHRRRGGRRRPTPPATRSWSRPRCRWAAAARPAASSWPTTPTRPRSHAGNILGMDIKGHVVHRVWVEHASDIAEEYYASFTLDRSAKKHLLMLSAQGGVEIETVAEKDPTPSSCSTSTPSTGCRRRRRTQAASSGQAQPRGHRRRRRHPREALPTASPRATATWPRSTR